MRNVLVPAEHEVDAGAQKHLEQVAGVVDDVPLATGAWYRKQVMVQYEDPQVGRPGELLLDPVVTVPPDLPVVEVRLGGVDRDDRDAALVQLGRAGAEELLEVNVADVAGVV